ncbi:hypothetical protein HY095_00800 [Candidatus Micrarchaeota archaeon]|nr:hypothetical protein [Candidatus Micrarchaeota archaeon]
MQYKVVKRDSFLYARAGLLNIGNTSIETPVRILTTTDLNHADSLMRVTHDSISISYPHKLYQVKRRYTEDMLHALAISRKAQDATAKKVGKLIRKSPAPVSWFEASIAQNTSISEAENTALFKVGLEAGAAINTIYDSPDLTVNELEKRIQTSLKLSERVSTCKGTVVRMPTTQSLVAIEAKTNLALKYTDGADYKYADPKYVHEKYLLVSNLFAGRNKFCGLADVPKTWGGNDRTSLMHIFQLYGFDSFSIKLGRRYEPEIISPQKRFDRTTLAHLVIPQEHTAIYGQNPVCFSQCPIDRHFTNLDDLLKALSPGSEQASAFRVHEAFDGQADFDLKRQAIINGNVALLNQFRSQQYAKKAIEDIFKVDIDTPKLSDFGI